MTRRHVAALAATTTAGAAIVAAGSIAGTAGAVNVACLLGIVTALGLSLTFLRRRLGPLTGIAAASIFWGLLCLAAAAASPHCPLQYADSTNGRCAPPELAELLLVGMLAPISLSVLILPPVYLASYSRAALRWRRSRST